MVARPPRQWNRLPPRRPVAQRATPVPLPTSRRQRPARSTARYL